MRRRNEGPWAAIVGISRAGAVVLALLLAAACDQGGEGEWAVTLQGPGEPLGSAVLLVSGEGILGLRGAAGTQVWSERKTESEFRAVVVQMEASGPLAFYIRTRDVSGPRPTMAIIELADSEDEWIPVAPEHRFRFQR